MDRNIDDYMDWVFEVQTGQIGRKLEFPTPMTLKKLQEQLKEGEVLVATTYYEGFTHVDVIQDGDDLERVNSNHEDHISIMRNLGYYALNPEGIPEQELVAADKS